MTTFETLKTLVAELKKELPGISFGYVGNVGVDRKGPYDDRSWRIFLPVSGRCLTYGDWYSLGATSSLDGAVASWSEIEKAVRRMYADPRRGSGFVR